MNSPIPINESDPRWNLVQPYVDGVATAEEVAELERGLAHDADFRAAFLAYLSLDAALEESGPAEAEAGGKIVSFPFRRWATALAAAIILPIGLMALFKNLPATATVAKIGAASSDIRWLSDPQSEGEGLREGTRLKLASGSVEIRFSSGALTRLHGPAHFEVVSQNSGFLHYGEAFSRADNEQSNGFTIQTHSGDFVDQGTEFLTTASVDGYSQLHVTSGAVDVAVPGLERQRLRTGSGIGIEPGEVPVLIRIEQGDETPAFKFPTIPPPSDSDLADRKQGSARVEWWPTDTDDHRNDLSPNSGPADLLIDGLGQTGEDQPAESLFFRDGSNGLIVIDLGSEVPISKINTYSWHRSAHDPDIRRRAVQRYTLWGCGETKPDSLPDSGRASGWTRIARVNTDAFFGVKEEPDRPPQQACSIFSGKKDMGSFRYLLFEVVPTPMPEGMRPRHTFFGEIDVFTN